MTLTAQAVADLVNGTVQGDASVEVDAVSTPQAATRRSLVFVDDPKRLTEVLGSGAGIVLAGRFAEGSTSEATLILCANPRLAFSRAARRLCPPSRPAPGIHPTAIVHPSASLGEEVSIGPHAIVEETVVFGARVSIGPSVVIGRGACIGDDCDLRAHTVVYPGARLGARVLAHAGCVLGSDGFGYVRDETTGAYELFPQIGRLVIEDDVELGALCTVDRGALGATTIGRGSKLDNQVHVAHNVQIGRNVVIAAQTGIAGSSVVEDGAVIAGQVGIADHVRIGEGAILGAQCGVPSGKVIRGPGVLFWGTPARPIKQYLKELAVLARMVKR